MAAIAAPLTVDFGVGQIVALVCAVVALFVSGFVSGSEIAYFSITPQQAEELDESPRSEAIRRLIAMPERLLATILIANNLVNVTIVVLMSFALSDLFALMPGWLDFLLQTVILTFLILLFGEILPKLVANTKPMAWARFATSGLNFFVKLFYPVSSILVHSTKIVNRVVTRQSRNITADELGQALEIADVEGRQDKAMLEGILKFGDTTASEIMTPRVDIVGLDFDMTFAEVMEVVVEKGYSRLPVFGDSQDDIRGVLYARDLLPYINVGKSAGSCQVAQGQAEGEFKWQKLIRKTHFVPESRMIDDLMEDFRKLKIHIAIVVDEFGGTQGVVTLEDVLEEIVGDINDEYDEEEQTYRRLPDDTYIFEGKTLLTDFFRITGLEEEDYAPVAGDCETVAGMLLAIKGDFPKEKEPLVYGRCRFLILHVEHHRIASVRVKVMPELQTA
ncbi:MAG: gliding motility-associated protein GldE [Muribaculaceae bacterium]|jgi:gliding motility-associated protein GldE|nr:gliding motility-associated protein GldE [Muribaculaceae bacterium]